MLRSVTALRETPQDHFLGKLVDDRFQVEKLLGVGTVGSVYRAQDLVQGAPVALKIWNVAAHNDQTRGRFMREAKALLTLRHPNIVELQGFGMIDVLPYVAMEYLDGRSLEALLASTEPPEPLDSGMALEIMSQILQALSYAHGHGVVHRDLKPDNVVLVNHREDGTRRWVKLLDYGLAKFLSPDDDPLKGTALTMTGMIMGTPLYMAPEQASGKSVDARVDVYAAGCLLFEMLSGRPPFTGESNAELFRAHMDAPVPKLSSFGRDGLILPELQQVIEKALAKRPEQRYANAGHMLAALQALKPLVPAPESAGLKLGLGLGTEVPAPAAREQGRAPIIAALLTFVCTAVALAYALLH
jgi:serine/threonine-protein kinase